MKILDFVFSPILSLFSGRFYRNVLPSSLGWGFLYLLYLAILYAVAVLVFVMLKWAPVANNFVSWFSSQVPPIVLDRGGLSASAKQPYEIVHPQFGALVVLDTTRETFETHEIKNAFFYVTKRKIYANDPTRNETRIMDIMGQMSEAKKGELVRRLITGRQIETAYEKAKPMFGWFIFFSVLIFAYGWKLGAALLYSVIALGLNQFREEKYSYPALLNVSIFALSAVSVLQFLSSFSGAGIPLNLPLWIAAAITVLYLALAILITSPPEKSDSI